jgi:stage IV sporulation protein FB
MELKIDLKIILFALIFYFTGQIEIYCLCLLFALIHELGHVLVARILGNKLLKFKIMPLGFSIFLQTNIEDYNKKIKKGNMYVLKNLIISIAGPITNIIIFLVTFFLPIELMLKEKIIYINAIIAIFNLIPMYPLDGSKILQNALKLFCSNKESYKYTNIVANATFTIFCSVFILYAKNIAIVAILIYLWYINIKENEKQKIRNKILNNNYIII